jgi:hypothetical protein
LASHPQLRIALAAIAASLGIVPAADRSCRDETRLALHEGRIVRPSFEKGLLVRLSSAKM